MLDKITRKNEIREFALSLGVDDIGFAAPEAYASPKSYPLATFLPSVKTMIVMVYKELSSCESESMNIAMNGRLDMNAFQRSNSYRIARFLEAKFDARVTSMPYSSPMEQAEDRLGLADFSQRHAAVAAGLGQLGRHNLLLHPRFGTRIGILSLLTDLELEADQAAGESLCIHCDLCVKHCPAGALGQPGKTDVAKCVAVSQPYGLRSNIGFWTRFVDSTADEQKAAFRKAEYWRIQQAHSLGMQYRCFNCMRICPVGKEK